MKPINNADSNKPVVRRADDIMKTIADWKSKTQLNKLDDDDDNDENNIRTNKTGSSTRLFQPSGSMNIGGGAAGPSRLHLSRALPIYEPPENSTRAEKYLDIVKDLKKKYTRSRTEVWGLLLLSILCVLLDYLIAINNIYKYRNIEILSNAG